MASVTGAAGATPTASPEQETQHAMPAQIEAPVADEPAGEQPPKHGPRRRLWIGLGILLAVLLLVIQGGVLVQVFPLDADGNQVKDAWLTDNSITVTVDTAA